MVGVQSELLPPQTPFPVHNPGPPRCPRVRKARVGPFWDNQIVSRDKPLLRWRQSCITDYRLLCCTRCVLARLESFSLFLVEAATDEQHDRIPWYALVLVATGEVNMTRSRSDYLDLPQELPPFAWSSMISC